MEQERMEIFVHAAGMKPGAVEAAASERLQDVLVRAGAFTGDASSLVFVGECDEALQEADEIEDGVDRHGPVDPTRTLHEVDLRRHRHVHVHRCRHVAVEVHFLGTTKRHRFSPATTVAVATAWARKKFLLDPASAAEYVLQLCNSTDQPRADKHLGELVSAALCSLCFDLVKEVTPQG